MDDRARIKVSEAARFLGCGDHHVMKLAKAGDIDVIDISTSGAHQAAWRVDVESLQRFVDLRSAQSIPSPRPPI